MASINDFGIPIPGGAKGILQPLISQKCHFIATSLTNDENELLDMMAERMTATDEELEVVFYRRYRHPHELDGENELDKFIRIIDKLAQGGNELFICCFYGETTVDKISFMKFAQLVSMESDFVHGDGVVGSYKVKFVSNVVYREPQPKSLSSMIKSTSLSDSFKS